MAKLSDILKVESQRAEDSEVRVIHLFQEGTFWRAYEWSAWLCCHYLGNFKVTRRKQKDSESSITFIGFPLTSLEKYSKDFELSSFSDEKRIDVTLPVQIISESLCQERFENWKQSQPVVESRNNRKEIVPGQPQSDIEESVIMERILSFPIESKSPLDCMLFLSDIKNKLFAMK